MAKQEAVEEPRRRRGKTDRAQAPSPEEAASHFDLDLWPTIPQQNRPKRIIFDALRSTDVDALTKRGYEVILLRTLPRRNAEEDEAYLMALMQAASEGTIVFDKGRSEALSAELRSRQFGLKKELRRKTGESSTDDIKRILDWQDTRHRFTENTTMLDPADVQRFLQRAAEENAKADATSRKRGTR